MSDELYREIRARAASSDRTVGQVIDEALRRGLAAQENFEPDLEPLPIYGGSGTLPGVDLAGRARTRDLMDEGAGLDGLR